MPHLRTFTKPSDQARLHRLLLLFKSFDLRNNYTFDAANQVHPFAARLLALSTDPQSRTPKAPAGGLVPGIPDAAQVAFTTVSIVIFIGASLIVMSVSEHSLVEGGMTDSTSASSFFAPNGSLPNLQIVTSPMNGKGRDRLQDHLRQPVGKRVLEC